MSPVHKRLWLGLALLALLTPLGLVVPAYFAAGDAWGEWSAQTLHQLLGYVPAGLQRDAALWQAPLPDYSLGNEEGAAAQLLAYAGSALVGGVAVGLAVYGISRLLVRHGR